MANLKALRQKIKNITDYSPELQQFNDQLDELINDAYYSIWTMKRWNFGTKIDTMRFHTDILSTTDTENNSGNEVTLACTTGQRQVVLSANIDRLQNANIWEGQPFEIETMEYTISKIVDPKTILLETPYQGETQASTTNYKIKKRWYDLPEDCLELLYIGHRDYPYVSVSGSQNPYGKSTAIMPRREEDLDLRVDYTQSYAEAYIQAPSIAIAPAERLVATQNAIGTGQFQSGNFYEFTWAFVKNGKVGALAEPVIHEVTTNNSTIILTFKSWDDTIIQADTYNDKDQSPTQWEGYRKVVFWNKNFDKTSGERRGLPCWIAVINGGSNRNDPLYLNPINPNDTTAFVSIVYTNQLDNGSQRYIEIDGLHQQIRPYPRPVGWDFEVEKNAQTGVLHDYVREAIIRYQMKPQDLLLSTDVPQMPYEFHQLVVYKALEDIYLKLGQTGLATTYEKKYMKEINNLVKRYVDKIDQQVVRGRFQVAQGRMSYDGSSLRRLP